MSVKKIGRAEINLEDELWWVRGRVEKFHMNLRLVSANNAVKASRSLYTKLSGKGRPPLRKPNKRLEHLKVVAEAKKEMQTALAAAYEEVREQSYSYPILLWKDRDFGRKMEWRCCIYKGVIYQFDKPTYSDEEMIAQIEGLEKKPSPDAASGH
jgi:hypothetical protein